MNLAEHFSFQRLFVKNFFLHFVHLFQHSMERAGKTKNGKESPITKKNSREAKHNQIHYLKTGVRKSVS